MSADLRALIEEAETLLASITPGGWVMVGGYAHDIEAPGVLVNIGGRKAAMPVARIVDHRDVDGHTKAANGRFIASAPRLVSQLLAVISAPPVDPAQGQCPDCGSANIGGNGHYREGDRTQRELMACEDCQHEWRPDAPQSLPVDLRPLNELVARLREESDRHQNIARHATDDGERDVAAVLAYSKQRTASRLEAVLAPLSGARQDEKENGKG